MKIIINFLVIVCAAALGLAAGFVWREKHRTISGREQSAILASQGIPQTKPVRVSKPRAGGPVNDDSPLAARLERDLSLSSGVTRWLYWLEALEQAAPKDFPRLIRLAQGNPTATRLIADRWVELNPRHLFDTIVAAPQNTPGFPVNELGIVLFREWPKRDPEAVIAALNEADNFRARDDWGAPVAEVVMETNAERGLRLLSDWHLEHFAPRMAGVARWAALDPQHAAEFTLENSVGAAARYSMETIGQAWAKTDPASALEFAASKPGELSPMLAAAALKVWAARDPRDAAGWLAGADAGTRNRLSASFVEAWAKQDASRALMWCEENLTGSSLARAVGGVLKGSAENDLPGAAALVGAMKPSPTRAEAAAAVAEQWFPRLSSNASVKPETMAWLSGLDAESVKRVLDRTQWDWSTSDPKSMAAFLAGSDSEQIPASAYTILAREMARRNPSEALEWAGRLPESRRLEAGAEAFAEWRIAQPETALKWLNELPAVDARRQPYFRRALQGLAYDPQTAEQFAALAATDRAAARSAVATMTLPENRRAKLLELLDSK